jgi:large subunit ribosomal protein L4
VTPSDAPKSEAKKPAARRGAKATSPKRATATKQAAVANLTVFDRTGKEVGKYEIDTAELAPRINKQLLHDAVVMYQSNQRLGTAKTKSRAEVAGSTKKMYRQKGTGNARAGSRRSGVRRGGGHIFAKRPRDWSYRLPRKAVQLATRMALAAKIRDDELTVIDELSFEAPKTKDMAGILKALGLSESSLLVATAQHDINVYKSARNIDRVTVSPVSGLNALNLLSPRRVLMTRAALDAVRTRVSNKNSQKT